MLRNLTGQLEDWHFRHTFTQDFFLWDVVLSLFRLASGSHDFLKRPSWHEVIGYYYSVSKILFNILDCLRFSKFVHMFKNTFVCVFIYVKHCCSHFSWMKKKVLYSMGKWLKNYCINSVWVNTAWKTVSDFLFHLFLFSNIFLKFFFSFLAIFVKLYTRLA